MRNLCFALACTLLLSSGCSALVADSGRDLSTLPAQSLVYAEVAEPTATGPFESDLRFLDLDVDVHLDLELDLDLDLDLKLYLDLDLALFQALYLVLYLF